MTDSEELRGRPIGHVVAKNYARAAAFQQFGLDFCCGGGKTIEAACLAKGIDPDEVLAAVAIADSGAGSEGDPIVQKSPAELARHIVEVHHGYVRRTLPALRQFAEKVARVHGPAHPYLTDLNGVVEEMSHEMTEHMDAEEAGIFRVLEEEEASTGEAPDRTLVLGDLEDEHEHVGALMRKARELTDGFSPPEGACATWQATYALLGEFEQDLHRHVHLENNVLFPAIR